MNLFELDDGEFPVEAQALTMESAWPALWGLPLPPGDAAEITRPASMLLEGLRLRLPAECIGLLTSSHFRWVPHRTYRNGEVYVESISRVLSEGAPKEKGIYTTFSHPILGARSVTVQQIKRISITRFMAPDFSVLDIFLTDEAEIREPGPWPSFDQSQAGDVAPPMWLPEEPDSRYLRLSARGPAGLNVALSWSQAFDYLEIPVQNESLDTEELDAWNEIRRLERREPWRPLSQRLNG